MFDDLYGNLPVFPHATNKWSGRAERSLSGDNRPLRIDMPATPTSSNKPATIQHLNEERSSPCELVGCLPSTRGQDTQQSPNRYLSIKTTVCGCSLRHSPSDMIFGSAK